MRKFLGGAVLALGVGGLGLYSNGNHATDMQTRITADATSVSQGSMHGIKTEVSGRDIRVSGYADSKVERANILAELNGIIGRRVVLDEIEVLPVASPYEMGSVKAADGQTYRGVVSSEATRTALAEKIGVEAASGLVLSGGLPDDMWNDLAMKGLTSLDGLESGEMTLSDHMLTVKGVAATPVEKAEAYMAIGAMPEGYTNDIHITTILDLADPFEVTSSKSASSQTYAGNVPSEESRSELAKHMGNGAAGLTHAWGAPDDNWTGVASKGLAALGPLETGEMSLSGQVLTVTGVAATPDEKAVAMAAVADLPDGYSADVNIQTIDDGKPAAYTIQYNPVNGILVEGKLPSDISKDAIAQALGVAQVSGDPVIATLPKYGTGDVLKKQLAVMAGWLPEMEGFSLTADGANTVIDAQLSPGVDEELVKAAIAAELGVGGTADLTVSAPAELPKEGDTRENAAVGREIFKGGFWLPVRDDFEVTAQNCSQRSAQALKETKVNFLTNSARLDAKSVRAINSIAGVILRCVTAENLKVEIGGHTDSTGDWRMNMDLSAERAQSVVDGLIARGVPKTRITAKGYGPSEPTTTNLTDEGKAANRRTTIRWSEVSE